MQFALEFPVQVPKRPKLPNSTEHKPTLIDAYHGFVNSNVRSVLELAVRLYVEAEDF